MNIGKLLDANDYEGVRRYESGDVRIYRKSTKEFVCVVSHKELQQNQTPELLEKLIRKKLNIKK